MERLRDQVGGADRLSRRSAAAARARGRDSHPARQCAARLPAVAAPRRRSRARPARVRRPERTRHGVRLALARTSSAWRRCRSTTASRTCGTSPRRCARRSRTAHDRGAAHRQHRRGRAGRSPAGAAAGASRPRGRAVRASRRIRGRRSPSAAAPSTWRSPRAGCARWSAPACCTRVQPLLIPMRGRMVHERAGRAALQPYGQREHEVIYSVGRADLNRVLIDAAARHGAVSVRFGQHLPGRGQRRVPPEAPRAAAASTRVPLTPTLATDGAGSAVRASLAAAGLVKVREEWLDHDYKELTHLRRRRRRARAPRAAHLAARRLHADRTAQHRRQFHRDAVPAAQRCAELRRSRRRGGGDGVLRPRVSRRAGAAAGSRRAICRPPAGAARHRAHHALARRRRACCCSGTPRTPSCPFTARA